MNSSNSNSNNSNSNNNNNNNNIGIGNNIHNGIAGPYKLYLVRFVIDNESCYKPGITSNRDVTKRFERLLESDTIRNFKTMKSSYFPTGAEAYAAEQKLFDLVIERFGGYRHADGRVRFHNFWTDKQHSGITEMRKYNQDEVDYCWRYIDRNGNRYFPSGLSRVNF